MPNPCKHFPRRASRPLCVSAGWLGLGISSISELLLEIISSFSMGSITMWAEAIDSSWLNCQTQRSWTDTTPAILLSSRITVSRWALGGVLPRRIWPLRKAVYVSLWFFTSCVSFLTERKRAACNHDGYGHADCRIGVKSVWRSHQHHDESCSDDSKIVQDISKDMDDDSVDS